MPRVTPDYVLAQTVRGLREDQGSTRKALAFESDITTGALARIELGYASPHWTTLRAIAHGLGMRTDQLVDQVEAMRAIEESAEPIGEASV